MKRDLDLIRLIHLKVEDDYDCAELINLKIDGYSAKAIAYNSQLAFEAGYLSNCSVQYADNGVWTFSVGSLTWEGHDFLDRIRDDSMWGKIKKAARDRGGAASRCRDRWDDFSRNHYGGGRRCYGLVSQTIRYAIGSALALV